MHGKATLRKRNASLASLESHQRGMLLEAIARSAEELLRTSDLTCSIPKVLEQIGHATNVDRLHMLEIDPAASIVEARIIGHRLWSAAGISTPAAFGDGRGRTMADVGLGSWLPRLRRGDSIAGHTRNFEDAMRGFFEYGGVKSAMLVPVFVEGQWWGFLCFDNCRSEREWSPSEIDTLKTLAALVGVAVTHTRGLQKLSDANRIIEKSPTILYRLSPKPPFELIYLSQNVRRYGYQADELLASPNEWLQYIGSEQHPAIAADIVSLVQGKTDSSLIEFRFIKSDGSYAWLEGRAYPVRDEEHRLVAIEGILTDITERKSVERLARDEFNRMQMQSDIVGQVGQFEALLSGDVEALARKLTELASRATGCERVNVWLFNDEETELRCIDLFEATPVRHSSGMTLSEKEFGAEIAILKASKFVNADDPLNDPRTAGYVEPYIKPLRITSMLDIVIQSSGRNFGLLCFEHVDQAHHWTQNEIAFARQLADKIGISIISRIRRQAEEALRQRDALLHSVAVSATEFVSASRLDEAMRKALELVSNTIQIDRMSILDSPISANIAPSLRFVRQNPEVAFQLDQTFFDDPNLMTPEIIAWQAPLFKGKIVLSQLRDTSGDLRAMLERLGTKTILLLPIMIDGKYWGQLALESCGAEREWRTFEIDILKMLGDLIVNSIRRERYFDEITNANRIIQNTPTILYRLRGTPDLPMTYVSQNIKLFGHEPAVLMASPQLYKSLVHPDDAVALNEALAQVFEEGAQHVVTEFRLLTGHGDYRWVEDRYTPIRDAAGRLIELEGLLFDIADRKAAEEKIRRLARTDSLTGLANRATFVERLQQTFAASRRGASAFALLSLDIDRFKDINDTLGHPVGDQLLTTVGERLKACVRESDIVARLGGDEFAILQFGLSDRSDAGALAAKIRKALALPVMLNGNDLRIAASIGISTYSSEIVMPDEMLSQADAALYRAKEEGRDQYRFHTEELDAQVREQVAVTEELSMAISRHEFELHYQPQVELGTGTIVGMEALVRWHHPTRGLLGPSAFLSAAEKSGAITAIGQWAIDRACKQMNIWRGSGIAPRTLALNISHVQTKAGSEFVKFVAETLEKWGVAPSELQFDVTESLLARAAMAQSDVLSRLQKLGIKISIDDFGTKYSTLDYLKAYRVNRLKIPQSMINAAERDAGSAATVRAIVCIARELNIEVIAQGVETEAQWTFLTTKSSVRKVQGFHYGKPVSTERAEELLRQGRIKPPEDGSTTSTDLVLRREPISGAFR
ncbi:MAG: EAL domain-containing protein [Pseudolabrys sp.]|nr:EAL domain-containing protein [Pseudolabrys sp.]MDP2298992.1 EAL domain-containing protein [Pseudolabrys sp.]